LWYVFFVAKNYDPVKDARRKFVQSRVAATGRSDAESKAKFRQRFEKLSSTKEGRQQIAKITNVAGVRKAIVQANKNKGGGTGGTGGTGGNGGGGTNNKYGRPATADEARVYKQGAYRKGPTYSRITVTEADRQAALDELSSSNPGWAGPLNQFGMPSTPTTVDPYKDFQRQAIGNYDPIGGDSPLGSLGNRTMDRVDYLEFLKKLKFWD
jgi:hypothetical protein